MQYRIFVLLVGLALIASACGSSVVNTTGVPTTTTTTATSTTTTPTPSTTTTSTPATSTVAVYFLLDEPVWENSAKDGSQINVREYPVWLTPGS